MQTVKPQRAAFLLNLSASSHRLSHPNYQDQTTTTTTALHSQTPHPPQTGAVYQPHQHGSMEDLEEQVSGLNTSGANSTIHEYVNMLSVNDETDSKEYDAIFRMVPPPTKRQQKAQNKRSSLEIKLSSQENLYNLGVTSGYATTRGGGGKAEAYSTLKDLKNLIKQPSHKKRESDLGVIKEKGKDITRTSPPLKSKMGYSKSCSKQSISKITASFQNANFNQKGSSGFGLSSSKSRRIPTEGNSKEIKQQFHHSSRLSTMPNDERTTFNEVMSPKTIQKQYINLGSPTGEHKNKNLIMSPGSSHKRENSSQSPGRSLQISLKTLNTGGSISRAVHAIATSRIDITREKKAAQQYTARKSEDQRAKENKPLKSVKIDIVEVNLAPKSARKKKAEECLEKIDENFEKLRKLINDKKADISQNDILLKALENLNTYITGTQTLIQTSKLS